MPKFGDKVELFEDGLLDKFLDRELYFKHNNQYLSLAPVGSCSYKIPGEYECKNLAVMQNNKNDFAKLKLLKSSDKSFRLFSTLETTNPQSPYLSWILLSKDLKMACFDGTYNTDFYNKFELFPINNGFQIKLVYKDITYFLSLCPEDSVCQQGEEKMRRLCFTSDKDKAIFFEIEFAEETIEEFSDNNNISLENHEIYSFLDSQSSGDSTINLSVDGAMENFGSANYKNYFSLKH